MTQIKSYTDLEQSRKLAEILPHESADMWYTISIVDKFGIDNYEEYPSFEKSTDIDVPCWSLTALLNVLPDELEDNHFLTLQKEKNEYCCCYEGLNNSFRHNTFADNPVDACVAMIERLHELKML